MLFVIVHKKLPIAGVYTKVNWNIAYNIVYLKNAMQNIQFQVFLKMLSNEKDKYKKVVNCKSDSAKKWFPCC